MTSPKKTYPVIIEQDEDGMYVATVPSISGCYTQGKTVKQVMERIREAISVCGDVDELKFVDMQKIQV